MTRMHDREHWIFFCKMKLIDVKEAVNCYILGDGEEEREKEIWSERCRYRGRKVKKKRIQKREKKRDIGISVKGTNTREWSW